MATKKDTAPTTSGLRRRISSTRFGIEADEAPEDEFPVQPSAKDGFGRMCHTQWRQYTNQLRKAAVARKAAAFTEAVESPAEREPEIELAAESPEASDEPRPRRIRRAKIEAA